MDATISTTKSKSDKKHYALYTVPGVGLEVLLISSLDKYVRDSANLDVSRMKAAAAMSVQVGSFADPPEAQGCAHFLEHMVFMGSEKYPKENHYDSFVSSNGGGCNAFTEGEHTVYQFDIISQYFAEALDIFAQCFISPLLSFASSDREIEAIDSEYNIAHMDDYNRWQQLLFESAENNPLLQQFSWGNKKSLVDCPCKKGVNMEYLLKSFHRQYYRPECMKLVVIAPKSLEELQEYVYQSFHGWIVDPSMDAMAIPSYEISIQPSKAQKRKKRAKLENKTIYLKSFDDILKDYKDKFPIPSMKMNKIYRIVPIKKLHKLVLTWQLPSTMAAYKTKPLNFLGHLIGYEGPGSILSALKVEGYANGVSAGTSGSNMEDNSMFSIFSITVKLTNKGMANWIHVCKVIYDYLGVIRDSSEEKLQQIFDELKQLDAIKYDFLDEENEEDLVERLSSALLPYNKVDRCDILTSAFLSFEWDYNYVMSLLSLMTPQLSRIDLMSPMYSFENDNDGDNSEDNNEEDEDDEGEDEDSQMDAGEEREEDSSEKSEDDSEDYDIGDIESTYLGPTQWKLFVFPSLPSPLTEPYFETKYWTDSIPREVMAYWSGNSMSIDEIYSKRLEMFLPPRNEYIPQSLVLVDQTGAVLPSDQSMLIDDIHEKSSNGKAANSSLPDLFYDSNGFKVWYLHDVNRFPVPKAEIFLRILSSSHIDFKGIEFKQEDEIANGDKSHRDRSLALILHDLSIAVVKDILNEKLYVASIAELYCDIESSQNIGMSIKVSGFGDKAHVLALEVTQTYFNLVNYINPSRPDGYNEASFLRELEDLCKKYENADMKASHAANNARMALLQPDFPSYYQRYHYLKRYRPYVTLWLLQEYMQTVMKGIYIEMLCQGNLSKVIVNNMIHNILSMEISRETLDEGSKSKRLVRDLCDDNNKPRLSVIQISSDPSISDVMGNARDDIAGTGSILLRVEPQSRNEKNICVQLYYQISLENILIITMLELYDQIISEPLFDDLRTKQQLGYDVSCKVSRLKGVLGYIFSVVSSSHSISKVQSALMEFIHKSLSMIQNLSTEEFVKHVKSVMNIKQLPPTSPYDAAIDNWSLIESGIFDLSFKQKQAEILERSLMRIKNTDESHIAMGSRIDLVESESSIISKSSLIAFVNEMIHSQRRLLIVHGTNANVDRDNTPDNGIAESVRDHENVGLVIDMRKSQDCIVEFSRTIQFWKK